MTVSPEILSQYKEADKFILVNDTDNILHPIKILLPEPPELHTIDGYGLPAREQKFREVAIPEKLKKLIRLDWETSMQIIHDQRDYYANEIEWIKKQWWHIDNGYWCFINGKPTYIDGWHYAYLNFWRIDVGLPDYRSRDRKYFLFARYCYTTTEAYYPYMAISSAGKAVYFAEEAKAIDFVNKHGGTYYEDGYIVDFKRRTCLGFNYPKHRREGATYKSGCINYFITIRFFNAWGGIQSMDGPSAKKAYRKAIVAPWRRLPFFFKPQWNGSGDPKQQLEFIPSAASMAKPNRPEYLDDYLGGGISFAESANKGVYDGDKLVCLHNDECGKTVLEDVDDRWVTQKKCLSQGNGFIIHGLSLNTSTVGAMEGGGGINFSNLCEKSHFENRNEVGQTTSGLFNLFIPAFDGLDGFIDIYGESIIEDPTEDDLWRIPSPVRDKNGVLMGARRYLAETLLSYLENPTPENMKNYEEEVRLHPTSFEEAFITSSTSIGFNLIILTRRTTELKFMKGITTRGNFKWLENVKDSEVVWVDDPVNGRWTKSLEIPPELTNKKYKKRIASVTGEMKDVWFPMHVDKFQHCADPYKYLRTDRRKSNGGGSCFWKRDMRIDGDDVPIDEWKSHRFILTYKFRPSNPKDYAEDMLMQNVYCGGLMFPEINHPLIWNHYVDRGYDGYLMYAQSVDGVLKKHPGFHGLAGDQQDIILSVQEYIELHGMRERHLDFLMECKKIKSIKDLTYFDLMIGCGGNLMGLKSTYAQLLAKPTVNQMDIKYMMPKRKY